MDEAELNRSVSRDELRSDNYGSRTWHGALSSMGFGRAHPSCTCRPLPSQALSRA